MPYTLIEALQKAAFEKNKYQENLMDKTFAYAYIDKGNIIKFNEVSFLKGNYLHLTGLDYFDTQYKKRVLNQIVSSKADEFFDRLGNDDSLINDVSFTKGRNQAETNLNYLHTQDKLNNLSQIVYIAKKAEYIGKYKDINMFDLLINRKKESLALRKRGNIYVPVSSRYGFIQNFVEKKEIKPVLAIFSKERPSEKYHIEYLNKDIKLNKNIRFDSDILSKFNGDSFVPTQNKINNLQLNRLSDIYTYSLKQYISLQLNEINQLRSKAYLSEPEMNEYINATKIFRQSIENDETYKIAKELLTTEKEQCSSEDSIDLITEEIEKLQSKFSPASGNIHIMKFESPEKKLLVNQDMSAAIPLNRNSHSLWGEIKKGISSLISGFKRSILPPPPPKTYRSISKPQKAAPAPPKKDSSHDKKVEKSENKPKQEARFSLSDLNSSKYAPRSHTQDKGIEHKNHIDR